MSSGAPDTSGLVRELHRIERGYAEQAERAAERAARQQRRAVLAEQKLKVLKTAPERLVVAALAFLDCIDDLSTRDFSYGADRATREALRSVLVELGATTPRPDTWEWDKHLAQLQQAAADQQAEEADAARGESQR